MSGIKTRGIWIAFGLSAGLHGIGFCFIEILPHKPISSPSLTTSLRLIKQSRSVVENPVQTTNAALKLHASSSQVAMPTPSTTNKNNEIEQTTNQAAAEIPTSESFFSAPIHYFDSNEVDISSEPLSEWKLRTDGIKTSEKIAIQLILFIGKDGKLDKFEILNSTLSYFETELLVRDLLSTEFKPALKDGMFVPNQKNVEIVLDLNPSTFRLPNLFNNFPLSNK